MAVNTSDPYVQLEHCFQGIWYPNIVLDSSIETLRTFEVRLDDVWVVTFPKSGTHWMMEIIGLILNDGYPDRIDRTLFSSTLEMINMAQSFPRTVDEDRRNPVNMSPFMDVARSVASPRVMMTHLRRDRLPRDILKKAKMIYFARNPKDVTSSWYNFVGTSPFIPLTWEENLQQFFEGRTHWGSWFEHVEEYWKIREDANFLFVFFEDLLKDPAKSIHEISEHIGHSLSAETLQRVVDSCSLTEMKKSYQKIVDSGMSTSFTKASGSYPFLNKGRIGQWKNRFTVAQNETFDAWYQDKVDKAGLDIKFIFE